MNFHCGRSLLRKVDFDGKHTIETYITALVKDDRQGFKEQLRLADHHPWQPAACAPQLRTSGESTAFLQRVRF